MNEPTVKLLVLEEESDMLSALLNAFANAGFEARGTGNRATAERLLKSHRPDVLLFSPKCLPVDAGAWLAEHLQSGLTPGQEGRQVRLFSMSRLPYDEPTQRVANYPGVKIITLPLPFSDLINVIKIHLAMVPSQIHYDQGVYDIIRTATQEALGFYLQSKLLIQASHEKENDRLDGEIMAMIPLSGPQFLGTIVLNFAHDFAVALAGAMLGDDAAAAALSEHELVDVVSETANQLAGLLQAQFVGLGWTVNIGMPTAFSGKNLRFVHPGRNKVAFLPLALKSGRGLLQRLAVWQRPRTTVEFCFDSIEKAAS